MDEAQFKELLAGMTPAQQATFIERVARCTNPERQQRLYTPLLLELEKVIAVHAIKSLAAGGSNDMLIPPDITQVLLLLISKHVAETSSDGQEPGAVSLAVSKVVAEMTFNMLTEKKKKKGGGRV